MRAQVWKKAVKQFLLPQLPGEWIVQSTLLVEKPVDRVVHVIGRASKGPSWRAWTVVQPLYVASDVWNAGLGMDLNRGSKWPYFPGLEDAAEGEAQMSGLGELIRDKAIPHFRKYGTPEGFRQLCLEQISESMPGGSWFNKRALAATELLLGDPGQAVYWCDVLVRSMEGDTRDGWPRRVEAEAREFKQQILDDPDKARDSLNEVEVQQRSRLKLPSGHA